MSCLTTLDRETGSDFASTFVVTRTVWNFSDENVLLSLAKAEGRNRFHRTKACYFQATYTSHC